MFCSQKTLENVVWELTLKCNANCLHCGSSAGKKRNDDLDTKRIFEVCDELAELQCKDVHLIGGEIFLYPLWKELITKLRKNAINVTIITNGRSLDKEKLAFLSDIELKTLGISLDGAFAETHNHIRQVNGLFEHIFSLSKEFEKAPFFPLAITTVSKMNILELPEFGKLLKNSFFRGWQVQIATAYGRMKEKMVLSPEEYYLTGLFLAKTICNVHPYTLFTLGMHDMGYYSKTIPPHSATINWKGCPAGKKVLGIRSNGLVMGCLSLYDENFAEGDLKKETLKEIWDKKNLCSWNSRLKRFASLKGYCRKCIHGFSCLAGCSNMSHGLSGNIGNMPLCYHAIEQFYKKHAPTNEWEALFAKITQGKMDNKGRFFLADGTFVSDDFIEKQSISKEQKKLLQLLR